MTRTVSLSRSRPSSSMTSPWKSGCSNPRTISWTGPMAMRESFRREFRLDGRRGVKIPTRVRPGASPELDEGQAVARNDGAAVWPPRSFNACRLGSDGGQIVLRPGDHVDERTDQRHEDHEYSPARLRPSRMILPPEVVHHHEDEQRDPDHPREEDEHR